MCSESEMCENTYGSYDCKCKIGFIRDPETNQCTGTAMYDVAIAHAISILTFHQIQMNAREKMVNVNKCVIMSLVHATAAVMRATT